MIGLVVFYLQTTALIFVSFTGAIWINCYYHEYNSEYWWKRCFLIGALVLVVTTLTLKLLTIFKVFGW